MTCKICHNNETDSTSGICWECCSYSSLLNKREEELKQKIGKEYNELSDEDKDLMLKTAGSIDFGYPVDLEQNN